MSRHLRCTILIISTFFMPFYGFGQSKKDSFLIKWHPTYKLKWDDFQGIPVDQDIYAAVTVSYIDCRYLRDEGKYEVAAIFEKKKSWVKEKYKLADVLAHEQGHFDITEIYARILLKSLKNVSVNHTYRYIYDSVYSEMRAMQKQYDAETCNSNNAEQQAKWGSKIKKTLTIN